MGDRSYIQIESTELPTPIVFYGHWSGDSNVSAVIDVLGSTEENRIGDAGYLAAQIFYRFAIGYGSYDGKLGFGIYTGDMSSDSDAWNDNPLIRVNADTGEYSVDGSDWESVR
jgi:hypothetical protein